MKTQEYLAKYLYDKLMLHFDTTLRQCNCDHNWQEYGHGYKCTLCDYYTGLNEDVNRLINKDKVA